MRSQTNQFYRAILDGHTVKVTVADVNEFNTIRTALHHHHRLVREIGGSELSLLADLNGQEALFRLGTPRRKVKEYSFEVITDGT